MDNKVLDRLYLRQIVWLQERDIMDNKVVDRLYLCQMGCLQERDIMDNKVLDRLYLLDRMVIGEISWTTMFLTGCIYVRQDGYGRDIMGNKVLDRLYLRQKEQMQERQEEHHGS